MLDYWNTFGGQCDGCRKKRPPNFNLSNPPIGGPQIKKKSGVKPNQKSRKNFFLLFSIFSTKKIYRDLKKNIKKWFLVNPHQYDTTMMVNSI